MRLKIPEMMDAIALLPITASSTSISISPFSFTSVIKNNLKRKPKKLWTDKGAGDKIDYYRAQSGNDEALFIISKIKEEIKEHQRDYKDFAVLYRTNAQSRNVEEALVKANIPYRIVGGHKFYDRKEIKDILAYRNLLIDANFKSIMEDEELARCVEEFFKYDLNVAEPSRKSYLHRNTLLYRIEKIANLTGLNIRSFDDAVTFRILMIIYNLTK